MKTEYNCKYIPTYFIDLTNINMSKTCQLNNVSFELWKVKFTRNNIQDFDQPYYFDYYERCNKLDPSHFDYHSSLTYSRNGQKVSFRHVEEQNQYILRICGCNKGMF